MKKKDEGHEETEELLRKLEKRISQEYKKAEEDVQKKLDDYLRRFKIKDDIKRKALQNDLISKQEYDEWRVGQIMMGQRWEEMRDALAQDFSNANQIAKSIAFGHMPEVYAINHNYGTFQVEKESRVDTSYTLYDRHTAERLLMDDNGNFIPTPGRKLSKRIAMGKDVAWNKKNVQSCMLQGILQGESISNMATRLAESVGEQNRKAAIRNVRTMTTGVENAGRLASYRDAENMGIEMKKQWVSTLDDRTRHWHRELDGVAVPVDEPFTNEEGNIMYPGDPSADPANIYNCRCTMIASLIGFERDLSDRKNSEIEGMTYDEWKEEHESRSDPITKQDEISEAMKDAYIEEYKVLANSEPNVEINREDAADDWFEYEKANAMAEYIQTGEMPLKDIDGNVLDDKERAKLKAEAELIQHEGENTKTKYKALYRGMVMDEDEVRSMYTPGEEYTFSTITATASDKDVARIYTNTENYVVDGHGVPVVMDISKPDGIYGFDRDGTEIVIPKGSTFKVTRNYMDDDGVVHISLYAKKGKNVEESLLNRSRDNGNITEKGNFRVDKKVNPNAGYTEPMTKKHVRSVMKEMDVDYGKARIVIEDSKELVGRGLFGYTYPDAKKVALYPDAFSSRENLVKTIGHEKIHLDQTRKNGPVVNIADLEAREKEAYGSEEAWWNEYKRKNGY